MNPNLKFERGRGGGGAKEGARVSDFLYKESTSKKMGGGGGGLRGGWSK